MFLWHAAAVSVNINHCWRTQILTNCDDDHFIRYLLYCPAWHILASLLYRVEWINLFSFSTLFHSSPKSKSIRLILLLEQHEHQTTTTRCAFHGQFKIQFFTDQIIIISSLNDKIIINSYSFVPHLFFIYIVFDAFLPDRCAESTDWEMSCEENTLGYVLKGLLSGG